MEVRPDLEDRRKKASTKKMRLNMEESERRRLCAILLKISSLSMEAFDIIDTDRISEADVLLILQLPDWCNAFTKGIEVHARKRIAGQDQQRSIQRTSYRGTGKT